MPKQGREQVRRTTVINVKFSSNEIDRLKAMLEDAGRADLRGFIRQAALGEMAVVRRQKRVPEINRRLYTKLAALQELLSERIDRPWAESDREYMQEALCLLRQVQKSLVGVAVDR